MNKTEKIVDYQKEIDNISEWMGTYVRRNEIAPESFDLFLDK